MTTICYKDGILAADSMLSDNGIDVGVCTKIAAVAGGYAAMTGDSQDKAAFWRWLGEGSKLDDKPKLDDDFNGVLVVPGGQVLWYDYHLNHYEFTPKDGFWAIGSGQMLALGAMAVGANAIEACKIACRYDKGSGEPVIWQEVAQLEGKEAAE